MRQRKVLFVMEGGGGLSQDYVRGAIYKDLFTSAGITVHYVGHHTPPPNWLLRPTSSFARGVVRTYEYQLFRMMLEYMTTRFNRHRIASLARQYDAVMFVKVTSLDLIERVRRNTKARLLYDMSDAVWLPFQAPNFPHIRKILQTVDAVTWDYQNTLDFARQWNNAVFPWPAASQVELFDTKRAGRKLPKAANDKIVLGWVGSNGTLYNLYVIWEALEKLFQGNLPIHLRLLGTGFSEPSIDRLLLPHFEHVSYSVLPYYSPQQMIDEVLKMDIGLFPLFDVQDSSVRGLLKALVYMSGEAAVIASPRGQVPELIQDGVNGMLANTTQEWIDKLDQLITDRELRQRIALAGLETVRRDYSLEKSFEALLRALDMFQN